ncbi:TPA: DNA adenine methylase [Enterococcus faecalis]|nr:DNA adenine methylase [Enterococcus faecalis]
MSKNNNTQLPQLLKWVGNKQRFTNEIISYMPEKVNTYIEPFLGSGAVLGNLVNQNYSKLVPSVSVNKFLGSDYLEPLIEIFNYTKSDPDRLIKQYSYWRDQINDERTNKKDVYEEALSKFNSKKSGLDFAYVSRASFSGIVRFRKSDGYMSTPVGPHTPISSENFAKRVMQWHDALSNSDVTFKVADYKEALRQANDGDLVYLDPPYGNSQKILYGAQGFVFEELIEEIQAAKERGVKCMLSYNGHTKSKQVDTRPDLPEGVFERIAEINVGISMVNRLQNGGKKMINESVSDLLLLTWD